MGVLHLPTSDQPRASILILGWLDARLLRRCLASIARNVDARRVPYEVVLVLNGATDEVVHLATHKLAGVRVEHSPVNLGFGGGNNRAARLARGEFLVLLNDDAEVERDWLESLVATADAHPTVGAVGSRILWPNGSMQECGSILWSNGSTMPIGRGLPAGDDRWTFLRRVDYVSACSLLIRADLFHEVGGFDMRYFPAYYEDVDLALAIRAAGRQIVVDPWSRIRHLESASSVGQFKAFLFRRNEAQLREKWVAELGVQLEPRPEDPQAIASAIRLARGARPRLLVIDDMLPSAGIGAGFGRMLDLLTEIGYDRYETTFCATNEPGPGTVESLCRLGVRLLPRRARPDIAQQLDEHLRDPETAYDVVLVSRPHNWEIAAPLVRTHQPDASLVYDAEALFHTRLERQAVMARSAGDDVAAERFAAEAAAALELEQRIARESDAMVCVSLDEAAMVRTFEGHCPVDVVEPVQPDVAPTTREWTARRDMVFVSGWLAGADSPNGDALRWFAAEVLPLIVAAVPWVRLRVTGKNPPEELLDLEGPNLVFTGFVADLHELYDGARVVVSPIRYGAGVKIKTTEALQHAVPTVTTTVGAEGMRPALRAGLAIADDPAEFAGHVIRLLTQADAWRERHATLRRLRDEWHRGAGTSWSQVLAAALGEGNSEHVAVRA